MTVATEAAIAAADGDLVVFTHTAVGAATGNTYDAKLSSEDTYANAFSKVAGTSWGDTDDEVFGGKLGQKMIHVMGIVGFWVGNRCGAMAAAQKKPRRAFGLAW